MQISSKALLYIVEGSLITLLYSVISACCGLVLGTLLALMKATPYRILQIFAHTYTSLFRGTPLLIQLSIIYFALPTLININISPLAAGIIAFSLNSSAYVSEIMRAGIASIDQGQFEAAKTLGIPRYYTLRDIIIPQAFKASLPALVNELISLIKETAIISVIGEPDLMRRAQMIALQSYDYFTPICVAGFCYYSLILIISKIGKYLEGKFKW